ncbi:hypothetical protein CK203_032943 [Vitis vinifera]|uniref:Uncharacterized protein n=1 Tax=Vitis vinifera TaxID=29760 RepID=A0A438HKY1_VITVI|nr:hypothetical protein CK203_032943 [Vitis vinifera]
MPTEKGEENVILFTKEQFNAGLRFPLPALFKEFLHFSQIPPIFIHPNLVRVLMGCSIINMLYSLDLTLLEVFFVYSLKKAKNDIFSVSAAPALPSNGDRAARFDKGRGEGAGAVRGVWAGLSQRASRPFSPNYTLKIPGLETEGPPCGLGGKGVLRLADAERRRKLLEDRDQKKTEGTIRKAPGQKRGPDSPPKKNSGKRRKLVKKHGKDVKEPTPPKEFPPPQTTYEGK